MEVLTTINEKLESLKQQRLQLVQDLQKDFPALVKPILDKSSKIESIGWTQYTPYFNDGDSCEFSRNSDLFINGEYEDEIEWNDWRVKYYLEKGAYKEDIENNLDLDIEECKIVEEIKKILDSVPEDFYKDLFGDHTKVTIYKDGRIETEEYSHD